MKDRHAAFRELINQESLLDLGVAMSADFSELELKTATVAAFEEIVRQIPSAIDCSQENDFTNVLTFTGLDLAAVIAAALRAAKAYREAA
jgi:hypothetical protein